MREQRSVCSHDDDDRADIVAPSIKRYLVTHGSSGDAKQVADAKIALDQHANCIATKAFRQFARGLAGAALEFEAYHSGPAAYVALGDWPRVRILHCGNRVVRLYMEAVDVVQFTIPRFGDNR